MPSELKQKATPAPEPVFRNGRLRYLLLFALSVLVVLSMISYDVRDVAYLDGGAGSGVVIRNWIGYFGAYVSRFLLLILGFSAYFLSLLLLVASARRLLGQHGMRDMAWEYWVAVALMTIGGSMLCGIWPEMLPGVSEALNLVATPGGALGQRFCAPSTGFIRLILNPAGSAIVASVLIAGGAIVVWLYDWHDLFMTWMGARREQRPAKPARKERTARELLRPGDTSESLPDSQPDGRKRRKEKPPKPMPAPVQEPLPEPAPPKKASTKTSGKTYKLPSIDLLDPTEGLPTGADPSEIESKKRILQATLDSFGIEATVGDATSGPRVTLLEVLPAPGVKVERISQLSKNIAMELQAVSLRMLAPIPGRKSVGIEVPNTIAGTVSLHNLLSTPAWKKSRAKIPLLLGRNISGEVVILDLARAPHLLIAGATGSGKSVCINTMIMSLLYRFTPEDLCLIMIDPKVVEFSGYGVLPHLVTPVISDVKKVPLALRWAIREMEHRYQILAKVGARNLESFNSRPKASEPELDDDGQPIPERLPFIVIIIDELADIMMTAKADVETSLARIAQLSRAVGIHTIIATQRPSVNVITGTIKANYPTRIAFQVTSQVDSRTILDGKGAESLLGRGDMLFRPPGASNLERNQGALVDDEEITRVVEYCAAEGEQAFDLSVLSATGDGGGGGDGMPGEPTSEADEELIQQAIDVIRRDRRATTSYIQRCLRIGYNRAALVIETLEQRGLIGPQLGTMPREIFIEPDAGDTGDTDDQVDDMDTPPFDDE